MKEKKLSFSQNAIYNTIGSIFYCICQWATTMLVVRLSTDYANAGILQLAISVTNIFYTISTFNMRTYQISDVKGEFSSGDYIGFRIITGFFALFLCFVYSVFFGYSSQLIACIFVYMIFKLSETATDVLHGVDQLKYRMDYICISYVLRGIVMVLSFSLVLIMTDNIFLSILGMSISTMLVVIFYDVPKTRHLDSILPHFNKEKIVSLFSKGLLMVLASASYAAVVTIPRQFLERQFSENVLGSYATVATPIVIVQVLVTGIFNPLLTIMAEKYEQNEIAELGKMILKCILFVIGFTAAAYVFAYFFGEFAYVLIYGESIRQYVANYIYPIIACTSLYTVCWLGTSILLIMRKIKTNLVLCLMALGLSFGLSFLLIPRFEGNGVSYTIIISYIIFSVIASIIIFFFLKQKKKNLEYD